MYSNETFSINILYGDRLCVPINFERESNQGNDVDDPQKFRRRLDHPSDYVSVVEIREGSLSLRPV